MKYSIGILKREFRDMEAQVESVSDRLTDRKALAKRRRKEVGFGVSPKMKLAVISYHTKVIRDLSRKLRKKKQILSDLSIAVASLSIVQANNILATPLKNSNDTCKNRHTRHPAKNISEAP